MLFLYLDESGDLGFDFITKKPSKFFVNSMSDIFHEQMPYEYLDMIFDVLVRDFSKYAVQLYQKKSNTPEQLAYCIKMIKNPAADMAKFTRVWEKYVYSLKGEYKMND